MSDDLPTPRTTHRTGYVRVHVWCKACKHQADADLERLIGEGRGDVPLRDLRFRCSNCCGSMTDFVVTTREEFLRPPSRISVHKAEHP